MSSSNKHPRGLPFLFLAEMWERFGYYLIIGIFTFYLKDTVAKGGFEMNESDASNMYGTFIAFVFLTPFLGGLLADRILGYRRSIIIGGIMMAIGYCLMSVHNIQALYVAMGLICLGNGFFKPNISTLLGNLYNDEPYKANKDAGFNIFYLGINVGAFISNFFAAAMYLTYGWGAAFITAGVGMFIGVIVFVIGTRHYRHADILKPVSPEDMPLKQIFLQVFLPAFVVGTVAYSFPETPLVKDKMTDAFLFACLPIIYYYYNIYRRATERERAPIAALLAVFFVSIAFWAVFKQNGAMMNTWAKRYTDREVPAALQSTLNTLNLTEIVTADTIEGKIVDNQFRNLKTVGDKDSVGKTVNQYLLNLSKDKQPKPGSQIYTFAPNLSQSVNPFWVIILTPLVVLLFAWMRRRKTEPSTPDKIALGLIISALSMFIMLGAVAASQNGATKASLLWFVGTYAVLTLGELCLSPMGLSLVSKLSPPRLTALMMGGWFLATSIGNKMAGVLSSMWDEYDDKRTPFIINIFLLFASAAIIIGMLKWLRRIFHENK